MMFFGVIPFPPRTVLGGKAKTVLQRTVFAYLWKRRKSNPGARNVSQAHLQGVSDHCTYVL